MSDACIAVLLFPLIVSRLGDLVFATNVAHRSSPFHCFQDRDDLVPTELASFYKVSFGLVILPGKSLLFDGPKFRKGYRSAGRYQIRFYVLILATPVEIQSRPLDRPNEYRTVQGEAVN